LTDRPGTPEPPRRAPVRKGLGQHFLTDPRILGRIADAIDPSPDDTVIEIGPGRGALTDVLALRAGRVIGIEYDRALAARLRVRYADQPNVTIVEADALDADFAGLAGGGPFKLIGNVPYYITTPILFAALERPRASVIAFLVQREVAERIVAAPGAEAYGALSMNVQAVAAASIPFRVGAGAFSPPPKVESAVIRVVPLADPIVRPDEEAEFRQFVIAAFGMRRKQMLRVLREVRTLDPATAAAALDRAGIPHAVRVETLSAAEIVALLRTLRS
jgi:16S rRNA (adenine1518-N6/adenine1519-N6)-dimethyltransferase